MSAITYIIIVLGAASVSVNIMRFVERVQQPRRRRRTV